MIKSTVVKITDRRLSCVRSGRDVFTSLEGECAGGSIKDHMVEGELEAKLRSGLLRKGDVISEISSGSTAKSLALYANRHGMKCLLFVPRDLDMAKVALLQSLGAELKLVDPATAFKEYADFVRETGIAKFDQFGDRKLSRHYRDVAESVGFDVDLVVGSIGTGHSLLGCADGFMNSPTIVSAEPTTAAAIPGIRNVRLESFGPDDPCDVSRLWRVEVPPADYFPSATLETDIGAIEIGDTFRVVLGALEVIDTTSRAKSIFAVGANNKRKAA